MSSEGDPGVDMAQELYFYVACVSVIRFPLESLTVVIKSLFAVCSGFSVGGTLEI